MASWHLENCIPIHQAHSRCFGESQSPGSGCAVICREKTTRHHRKKRSTASKPPVALPSSPRDNHLQNDSKGPCLRQGPFLFALQNHSLLVQERHIVKGKQINQAQGMVSIIRKGNARFPSADIWNGDESMKIYRNCNGGTNGCPRCFPGDSLPPVVIENSCPQSFPNSGCCTCRWGCPCCGGACCPVPPMPLESNTETL